MFNGDIYGQLVDLFAGVSLGVKYSPPERFLLLLPWVAVAYSFCGDFAVPLAVDARTLLPLLSRSNRFSTLPGL